LASLVIVALTKLFHTMGGLYMYADPVAHSWLSDNTLHYSILHPSWEFVTTLDYEWNVIQGRRPYRWTYGSVTDEAHLGDLVVYLGASD